MAFLAVSWQPLLQPLSNSVVTFIELPPSTGCSMAIGPWSVGLKGLQNLETDFGLIQPETCAPEPTMRDVASLDATPCPAGVKGFESVSRWLADPVSLVTGN